MKRRMFFGLNFKVIIAISLVIILTSIILSWFFVASQSLVLKGSVENRALVLANSLAMSSEYGVITSSKEFLAHLTRNTIKEEDVLYSVIYDVNGIPLAVETVDNSSIKKEVFANPIDSIKIINLERIKIQKESVNIENFGEVMDMTVPILSYENVPGIKNAKYDKESVVGAVRIGMALDRVNYQIDKMARSIIILTFIVIFAGIIISFFLVRVILTPIRELTQGTRKIAAGNLSYRVSIHSNDEFRELARSFNSMASDMEAHIKELNKEKKELLSLKIAFEQRSYELEETLDKVQKIQQDLIKSEKFATIGRLASSVAHELRNPLAAVKNIAYFLSKMGIFSDPKFLKLSASSEDSEQISKTIAKSNQMIKMLSDEVLRANKIITDLLDYSRTKKLNKLSVDIIPFINKVIPAVVMPDNVKVVTDLQPYTVAMDPDKITQVLINLITNAKDAMPADKKDGLIKVSTRKTNDAYLIIVQDNACGMSEETLEHLFEPLFTTKLKGIGLGLPIVKEIIDAHQGRILVTSTKDVGTTFTVELPL
ncbi:MAG: HAMP domain-containing protein [Elusimicrobia bacterium]|nr:HAMP domain-containing protein [Elusimicrobiota bacterium]